MHDLSNSASIRFPNRPLRCPKSRSFLPPIARRQSSPPAAARSLAAASTGRSPLSSTCWPRPLRPVARSSISRSSLPRRPRPANSTSSEKNFALPARRCSSAFTTSPAPKISSRPRSASRPSTRISSKWFRPPAPWPTTSPSSGSSPTAPARPRSSASPWARRDWSAAFWARDLGRPSPSPPSRKALKQTPNWPPLPARSSLRALRDLYRVEQLDQATRLFAVAGNPIAHSLSPLMQNTAFRRENVNAILVPLKTRTLDDLLTLVARTAAGRRRRHHAAQAGGPAPPRQPSRQNPPRSPSASAPATPCAPARTASSTASTPTWTASSARSKGGSSSRARASPSSAREARPAPPSSASSTRALRSSSSTAPTKTP